MSQEEADPIGRELVIIRRRAHSDGEAHHGGVWKIAYADFMTAMMAFFLVMWLINAANEETRAQVASYFNPVKLVDSRTSTKGLQDLDAGADGVLTKEPVVNRTKTDGSDKAEPGEKKITEEMLLRQPFAALDQIAGPAEETAKAAEQKAGALPEDAGRPGRLGGKAYLDPFDPQTWQRVAAKGEETAEKPGEPIAHEQIKLEKPPEEIPGKPVDKSAGAPGDKPPVAAVAKLEPPPPAETKPPAEVKPPAAQEPKPQPPAAARDVKDAVKPGDAKHEAHAPNPEQDAKLIEKEIKNALGVKSPGASPKLEVRSTANGVLISLTDDANFGMFAIASAEPQPVLVDYMEKIGKILNERTGKIIIRGHTDGRPFRSEVYDNWRLSSARAHMAYYMLVRAGIDEKRVERIEGYADRELKVPNDPEAAENRRIEILLEEGET